MAEKLIVIGNGMAGCRAVEELLARAPGKYDVEIFGAEPQVNYNRIMLSPVLAGEKRFDEIIINGRDWYDDNAITLHAGVEITAIDLERRRVADAGGRLYPYDKLLIATGSKPLMIPIPGNTLEGVMPFRDIGDVEKMTAAAKTYRNAVVIGGGLLGLEAANGLRANGMEVAVIHLVDTLMERQLDEAAGFLLKRELEARGIKVLTGATTESILGEDRVSGVRLEDGRILDADLVVIAVGIRPNIALAGQAGLACNRGIMVDDHMRTSDPAVLSVGECVEHRGQTYGLVAPLWDMCKAAADSLAGLEGEGYGGSAISTKLKITGIDLFSAGNFAGNEHTEDIILRDAARGVYRRLVLHENRIAGIVMFGDVTDSAWFYQLLREGADVSSMREILIFGQSYAGGAQLDPMAAVAALPDSAEICGCNGVCKGTIVGAIQAKGLTTLEEVRAHTKASSSCGTCSGTVEQLMAHVLGEGFARNAVPPMCPCTDHGHDEVRRIIAAAKLKSIPQVMQELGWKTPGGCAKCRPALNFYLIAAWPGDYADDYQSRFINERVHANIQKDGTYSVVPRMWGGLTTPAELRAIADVAEKFSIPEVKMTGGQRIDLLGVKKEDLPAVWADLNAAGMVSGHAYAKGLRTVKTCVGTDWCRFGTQDSTGLGVKLEKLLWGSWTPHKVKLAVSGCPRNCAEATCKDFGVVCVDSGYELHFAGAAGMEVKKTEILCNVASEDEVLEYCAATVQLYREQGHYLERMYKWAARVGADAVRAAIAGDEAGRKALADRFLHSQKFAQVDPWAERASGGVDAHEFAPLGDVTYLEAAE